VSLNWCNRGYDNIIEKRRVELRRMAKTAIEAQERKAITAIELSCLEAQTKLATAGLTSEAARRFVEQLPSINDLMPQLSFAKVAGEADPPVAEQLVSPNALRQRRHRERHRLTKPNRAGTAHNVTEPLRNADPDGDAADMAP
jgi:hypothetical protein